MNACSVCSLPKYPSPTVAGSPLKATDVLSDPVMSCGDIGVISKTNEWNSLKRQSDEVAREDSACADSIELDADFHRRFAELMNRVCGASKYYQNPDPFPRGS